MILVHGLIYMRNDYLEYTGIDLFESITIPSASMKCFRKDLPTDQLALVPHMVKRRFYQKNILFVRAMRSIGSNRLSAEFLSNGMPKRTMCESNRRIALRGSTKSANIDWMGSSNARAKEKTSGLKSWGTNSKFFGLK
jgi:hypothetical protein